MLWLTSLTICIWLEHYCVSVTSVSCDCRGTEHFLVYLIHHVVHQLIYVFVQFSGSLKVRHLVQISKTLSILVIDYTLILEVNFVSDESFNNAWVSVLVDAFQPVFHVIERNLISYVKCDDNTICLLVE